MKKRLRKKHLGEYREWGRQLLVTLKSEEDFDEFLEDFIIEAVEANGLYCGGGGRGEKVDIVVELGFLKDDPEAKMRMIKTWLDTCLTTSGISHHLEEIIKGAKSTLVLISPYQQLTCPPETGPGRR